ncbi:transporter [uncultured Shewanella sp.]|uniref:SphA family protein n=1 Tax=uncultured Shewanella sp. TaxID=173975 RepID=UPI0026026B74|nr:transporter [uncultured Shewanella sp.]
MNKVNSTKIKSIMLGMAGLTGLLLNSVTVVAATSGSHYPMGGEGVAAATLPPPGMHYRMYNTWYNADTLTNDNGDETGLDFELSAYAQVHRFVHMTEKTILGANWGYNVLIPMVSKDISINPIGVDADTSFALGDVVIEPLVLNWPRERFDAVMALAVIAPTGDHDVLDAASPGYGYWTGMLTAGGTYYLDTEKSWTISALTRTLVHTEQDDTDVRPGAEFTIEGGLGKQLEFNHTWLVRPGITYCATWQISDDSQDGPGSLASERKQAYGVGAEINLFYLPWLLQANLRYVHEFGAKNTTEGSSAVFTLTKSF